MTQARSGVFFEGSQTPKDRSRIRTSRMFKTGRVRDRIAQVHEMERELTRLRREHEREPMPQFPKQWSRDRAVVELERRGHLAKGQRHDVVGSLNLPVRAGTGRDRLLTERFPEQPVGQVVVVMTVAIPRPEHDLLVEVDRLRTVLVMRLSYISRIYLLGTMMAVRSDETFRQDRRCSQGHGCKVYYGPARHSMLGLFQIVCGWIKCLSCGHRRQPNGSGRCGYCGSALVTWGLARHKAMTGKVSHLAPDQGFFFITTDDGTKYFAHVRDLAGGQPELDQLKHGDVCTFTPYERPGRSRHSAARSIEYVQSVHAPSEGSAA